MKIISNKIASQNQIDKQGIRFTHAAETERSRQ